MWETQSLAQAVTLDQSLLSLSPGFPIWEKATANSTPPISLVFVRLGGNHYASVATEMTQSLFQSKRHLY